MSKRIRVKPGKAQSKIGFVVGILFVIMGCIIVIPTFGLFGVIWTVVAGFITLTNMKNAFTSEGVASHEIIIDDDTAENLNRNGGEDIEAKMSTLRSMYEQGLITGEEYEQKRRELLDKF